MTGCELEEVPPRYWSPEQVSKTGGRCNFAVYNRMGPTTYYQQSSWYTELEQVLYQDDGKLYGTRALILLVAIV